MTRPPMRLFAANTARGGPVAQDITCPLAPELTQGKTNVTVRFQAHPGNTAGGLFGLRTVERR